ncbi:uncharacterized protein MONOS_1946 [Monocercomonoides exilis]|uniref:uncharacterized protein n=1 Tax=Monocercomonoides exilis TaxID=2049356 RepID=UPI00355A343F|nr:hypothetical protein MONOS_1946 [Monocercomonoides exilis]|eukprot:MONOS_1946.1-p1 / transcript=MONOS_1946.1 / gene=MONOS_1946 / organism=Monocercomonoides_exilis_PA203 / gene_product=unspecified product / transcript_product=unspecified product / location=Mono_scaffold00037:100075-101169(+) / protein_length=364 / sequence_SO=supercontig / SO=protein_coding / is_pseudo=false
MIESLHNHTTTSDGVLTHMQFLEAAQKNGFSVVGFTDHDSLPSTDIVSELNTEYWKKDFPVKYVWGIEITARPPIELGITPSNFHIVGLFVDPLDEQLQQYCKVAKERRIQRMQFLVKKLVSFGFNITEEDCLKASGGGNVGRPHTIKALKMHPENEEVMKQIVKRFEKERETDESLRERFPDIDAKSLWDKAYPLFLSRDGWTKGMASDIPITDLRECCKVIHDAGGIALLGHYFSISKSVSLEMIEQWLKEGLLDGAETIYDLGYPPSQIPDTSSSSSSSTKELPEYEEVVKKRIFERDQLKSLCQRLNKLWWVGGGDIHTLEGMSAYVNSPLAKQTIGMTDTLLKELHSLVDVSKTTSFIT